MLAQGPNFLSGLLSGVALMITSWLVITVLAKLFPDDPEDDTQ